MAISTSTALLPFKSHHHNHHLPRSGKRLSLPFPGQKPLSISSINRPTLPTKTLTTPPHALTKTNESLTESVTQKSQTEEGQPRIADFWRQIEGEDNWEGLLDPIHPLLRTELIRYGEMAQATYDAFDFDPYSSNCGSCRFPNRLDFFKNLGMEDGGFEVTRYLYATSNINLPNFFKKSRWPEAKIWSTNANWIGYVSVSNDEQSAILGRRNITISWRGTVTKLEWIDDILVIKTPVTTANIPCPDPTVKVESGFLALYKGKDVNCPYCKYSAREQILTEVKRLVEMYPNEEISITVTGHSLGAALAVLSAYDIVESGLNVTGDGRKIRVSAFTFAGPRVGNLRFRERVEELGLKVLRMVNVHDLVPKVPGFVFNENFPEALWKVIQWWPWSYFHVGVLLKMDHLDSPYLREDGDIPCRHNLEAHLHLLDGYPGKGDKFVLTTGRDPSLVNKSSDFLKDSVIVPPNWRQIENKGLVRTEDGRWVEPPRPTVDGHPEGMLAILKQLALDSSNQ